MPLTLNNFKFITTTISRNNPKFYNPIQKSAGVFGITNLHVKSYGIPIGSSFIEDLSASENPYADFRFNSEESLRYLLETTKDLVLIDNELEAFVRATSFYAGLDNGMLAIDAYLSDISITNFKNLSDKISLFTSKLLLTPLSERQYFLINTSKLNFLLRLI